MNMMSIPDLCPQCKEPTIGDGCERCGWTFMPSALPNNARNANAHIVNPDGNGGQPPPSLSSLTQDPDRTTEPSRSFPLQGSEPGRSSAGALSLPRSAFGNSRGSALTLHNLDDRLSSLETIVGPLKGLVERPEQIKNYLLDELGSRLHERFQKQDQFIATEVHKVSEKQKLVLQQELTSFITDKTTETFEPAFTSKISDLDKSYEERLQHIIEEKLDVQLMHENIDDKLSQVTAEHFKKNFADQFRLYLDEVLLSKEDFVEIQTDICTGHPVESHTRNPFAKIWLWLSGTSLQLIAHCPESEVKKYQALGMTMLIPMTMAFIACFHLVRQHLPHKSFSNIAMALLISLLWATAILFIDRLLLVSYRPKKETRGKWAQFGWRLVIALMFAVIFDASLLPTVFARDVAKHLKQLNANELTKVEQRFQAREADFFGLEVAKELNARYQSNLAKIDAIQQSLGYLAHDIETKTKEADKAHERAVCESEGGPGCEKGKKKHFGQAKAAEFEANAALEKAKEERNRLQAQLADLTSQNATITADKEQLRLTTPYQALKVAADQEREFEHNEIMASSPSKENEIVFHLFRTAWETGDWFSVAIFLAFVLGFILVDTFPIVMKFFMPQGRYDALLAVQDHATTKGRDAKGQHGSGMPGSRLDLDPPDKDGQITTTLFNHTDLGLEMTTIHARFDPRKSHTAWPAIHRTLRTQVEPRIREMLKPGTNNNHAIPDYGFSSFCFRSGSPSIKL